MLIVREANGRARAYGNYNGDGVESVPVDFNYRDFEHMARRYEMSKAVRMRDIDGDYNND